MSYRQFCKLHDLAPVLEQPGHRVPRDVFGGGGGGEQQTVNTVQNADPWSGVQPYLSDIFGRAQTQSYVAPFKGPYLGAQSQFTTQAQQLQADRALGGSPLTDAAQGNILNTLGGGGAGEFASGYGLQNPFAQGSELNRSSVTTAAPTVNASALNTPTIRGDYLSVNSNPYLKGAVNEAMNNAKMGVSKQFAGDNYGSSANQEWLGKAMAGAALPYYTQAYESERGRQYGAEQNARSMMYGAGESAASRQQTAEQAALGRQYGAQQTGLGLQYGAQQADAARQMQAAGMAPGLAQQDYFDISKLAGAGASVDARSQAEADAARAKYQAQFEPLQRYASLISGQGQQGGTTSTQSPYFTNPLASALGLGVGGLNLYNGLGKAGLLSSTTPSSLGAFGGSSLAGWGVAEEMAALGGGFFSDRRLKTNVERVGTHRLGIGVYTYDIFGQRQIGVMADEVEKVMPDAVGEVGGFKTVNYGKL